MDDCETLRQKKEKCFAKNGEKAEKCRVFKLKEKRCLAFRHCPVEAIPYYGTLDAEKAMCGAFEEAFCFGNPRIMGIDSAKEKENNVKIYKYHQRALGKIGGNRQKFRQCKSISSALSKCLRQAAS
ncbi:unnamed protein product [Cylindrotheca closterium]|uniref:Uncharacterized protein n=1 Tax=Cylindrotheca closterium TaxID=2856 RepID=A0AAD2JKP0_9STRA|nr:unnamed protein product [Cylindrotheca closterium]